MALSSQQLLNKAMGDFYADPLGYAMFNFPWQSDRTIQVAKFGGTDPDNEFRARIRETYGVDYEWGLDEWACLFLERLRDEIIGRGFDGRTAVEPIRMCCVSGHGIGKSNLSAILIKFIMDTRPLAQGRVTATTADQLKGRTWAELAKWHNRSKTRDRFELTSGRGSMNFRHKLYPEEWKCEALTSREENSEAFAGLHAVNSTPFYLFDESSGIPEKIFEVRDGGLTDGEPMTFDFGNGTRNSGRFYENCAGRQKHRHIVFSVDSRDVQITNKALFEQFVEDWGEDSDFVKVRVRGMFPSQATIQFISGDDVSGAMKRATPSFQTTKQQPLVIGVDVARFGDDETVIWPRIGDDARSWAPDRYKGMDTVWTVGRVCQMVRDFREKGFECSGLFVDGGNTGGAVVDQLRALGYDPIEVTFGRSAEDRKVYRYVMDEIWGKMRDALKTSLVLPGMDTDLGRDLEPQLTQREFGYTGERIALESKTMMKQRGLISPDLADAIAVTYYRPVVTKALQAVAGQSFAQSEYDPLQVDW